MTAKKIIRKSVGIVAVVAFTFMVLSLGITYAIGANQMQISGQAFFVTQSNLDPTILPIAPVPDANGNYFTNTASGTGTVQILRQDYVTGDLYLSMCATNSNNGNSVASFQFHFANPTVLDWTNGTASFVSPWPATDGGLTNNAFTFTSATVTPTTLSANQQATVTLNYQAQLGKNTTQGSAIVTVQYTEAADVADPIKTVRIYITYYPRSATYGCTLV
ncbi:hypothetical protein FWF48_03345 [Candidatus Saccharibacteria bacterium]|nr:hypothetical protein [Candidatus Saccharibacteria bacterium]